MNSRLIKVYGFIKYIYAHSLENNRMISLPRREFSGQWCNRSPDQHCCNCSFLGEEHGKCQLCHFCEQLEECISVCSGLFCYILQTLPWELAVGLNPTEVKVMSKSIHMYFTHYL